MGNDDEKRWSEDDRNALKEIRRILKKEFASQPPFPEVVGDRRLLRSYRGNQRNLDKTVEMIAYHLKWRAENNVDAIRQEILFGGKSSPILFPHGDVVMELAPHIVFSFSSLDYEGRPLITEQYDFSPTEIFEKLSIEQYLTFLTYCLEYRALALEQMSEERELQYLKDHPNIEDREVGYGVIIKYFAIRDMQAFGFDHMGSNGRTLISASFNLVMPNYEEFMGKCYVVNVPWIFSTFWYFVKGFLDEATLAKITLIGSDFLPDLLREVPIGSIPQSLGGELVLAERLTEAFPFNLSDDGPLHVPTYSTHLS